jgi:DnaJ-class molecular chaperone
MIDQITADDVIEVLRNSRDGNELSERNLALCELALNRKLSVLGMDEFKKLQAERESAKEWESKQRPAPCSRCHGTGEVDAVPFYIALAYSLGAIRQPTKGTMKAVCPKCLGSKTTR